MINGSGNVLVTGGAGFIGSYLVEQLLAEDHAVCVLEKPGVSTAHLPEDDIKIVFADIRDARAVEQAAQGFDVVLHLAANPNLWARDPDEFEQVNHQGTRHVLAAARAAGPPGRAARSTFQRSRSSRLRTARASSPKTPGPC